MKFSKDRYLKDRDKSYERSKAGELKLIAPSKVDLIVEPIFERHKKEHHPLFEKAEGCEHKLALGCKLPFHKRKKSECEACL